MFSRLLLRFSLSLSPYPPRCYIIHEEKSLLCQCQKRKGRNAESSEEQLCQSDTEGLEHDTRVGSVSE